MARVSLMSRDSQFLWQAVIQQYFPQVATERNFQMFEIAMERHDPEWRVYKAAFGRRVETAYPGIDVYAEIGWYIMQVVAPPGIIWTQEYKDLAYTAFGMNASVAKEERLAALDDIENLIGEEAFADAMNGAMGGRAS